MNTFKNVRVDSRNELIELLASPEELRGPTAHMFLRIAVGPKLLMRVWTRFLEKQQPKSANDPTDDPP